MPAISFTLNGENHELDTDGATPLLYVLRDVLGLNSPRYGCGQEQCGSCRVIVDGKLTYTCTTPLEDIAGAEITTIEGLGQPGNLHPLQQGFLECNAAQCGYCSSGIIMTAYQLLGENADPSRQEIQAALADNLCRCGAHNRVIKAVQRAAEIMREAGR
jgi:nicotinate dehydrogenase subunit A